jgi:hypothetical protein
LCTSDFFSDPFVNRIHFIRENRLHIKLLPFPIRKLRIIFV